MTSSLGRKERPAVQILWVQKTKNECTNGLVWQRLKVANNQNTNLHSVNAPKKKSLRDEVNPVFSVPMVMQ